MPWHFPRLTCGGTFKAAPGTQEALKLISRMGGRKKKKALFAKNEPLIYTNLHPSLYTLYIVYIHSISHWMSTPQSSTGPAPGHSHHKAHPPTPDGSFLNQEMTHPESPRREPPRALKETIHFLLCAHCGLGEPPGQAEGEPR